MEFDVKRVYTALDADKLKVGSECIFADTMETLKTLVRCDDGTYNTLKCIGDESCSDRFVSAKSDIAFNLAYLVAEPLHLKWTDLKVGDVITKGVRTVMVTVVDKECRHDIHIFAGEWLSDDDLELYKKLEEDDD